MRRNAEIAFEGEFKVTLKSLKLEIYSTLGLLLLFFLD